MVGHPFPEWSQWFLGLLISILTRCFGRVWVYVALVYQACRYLTGRTGNSGIKHLLPTLEHHSCIHTFVYSPFTEDLTCATSCSQHWDYKAKGLLGLPSQVSLETRETREVTLTALCPKSYWVFPKRHWWCFIQGMLSWVGRVSSGLCLYREGHFYIP